MKSILHRLLFKIQYDHLKLILMGNSKIFPYFKKLPLFLNVISPINKNEKYITSTLI